MSMAMTASRQALCSASQKGNQLCRPQESFSTFGSWPSGAYQAGLSQPLTSVKKARSSFRRSWKGERLQLRAVSGTRVG